MSNPIADHTEYPNRLKESLEIVGTGDHVTINQNSQSNVVKDINETENGEKHVLAVTKRDDATTTHLIQYSRVKNTLLTQTFHPETKKDTITALRQTANVVKTISLRELTVETQSIQDSASEIAVFDGYRKHFDFSQYATINPNNYRDEFEASLARVPAHSVFAEGELGENIYRELWALRRRLRLAGAGYMPSTDDALLMAIVLPMEKVRELDELLETMYNLTTARKRLRKETELPEELFTVWDSVDAESGETMA